MRSRPLYAFFILVEAILAFALGVFGNKVADLLRVTPETIVIGASIVVGLLYLATLSRLRFEAGESPLPGTPSKSTRTFFLNAVLTVFPVSIVAGMFVGFVSTLLLPGRRFDMPWHYFVNDHELLATGIGFLAIALVAARRPRRSVVLMLSTGYALGLAGSLTILAPGVNSALYTFPGLLVTMVAIGAFLSSAGFSRLLVGLRTALSADETKPGGP